MTLRLTKRAIRVLTARYRAVLLAAIMGSMATTGAMAADGLNVKLSVDGSAVAGLASGDTIGTVDALKRDLSNMTTAGTTVINNTVNDAITALNLPSTYEAKGAAAAVQGTTTETVASVDAKVGTNTTNISANTAAIAKLNGDASTAGSVAKAIADAASNYVAADLSNLTDAQKNAINSGVTSANVTQIGTNKSAIEILNGDASTTGSVANTAKGYADTAETNAKNYTDTATTLTAAGKNYAANDTALQAIAKLDTVIGNADSGLTKAVADNTSAIATLNGGETDAGSVKNIAKGYADTALSTANTNIDNAITYDSTAGIITFKNSDGSTVDSTAYSKDKADTTFAGLAANNTFSGNNTFNGKITSTGDISTTGDISAADGTFSGTLNVTGTSTLGAVNAQAISGTTGTFSGALTSVGLNAGAGAIQTTGTLAAGASTLDSLDVTKNATVGGTLGVTGKTTLSGDLAGTTATFTGAVTTGALKSDGLDAGSGLIKTTGALQAGDATVSSLNAGSGTVKTTGAVEAGTLAVTGASTFNGLATMNAGLAMGGKTVTAIETAAVAAGAGKTDTLATTSSVLASAQNGTYSGTKVKGDTTSATLGTALDKGLTALNNVLIADGSKVDDAKVEVLWNSTNSTLETVLGNGAYTSTNQLTAGDSVTKALSALDTAVGNTTFSGKNATGAADLTVAVNSLDTAIGDRSTLSATNGNLTANSDVVTALNALDGTLGNVKALDGTDTTGPTGNLAGPNSTVAQHLTAIDTRMGQINGLVANATDTTTTTGKAYYGNLAVGTTVEDHLEALDASIGDRRNYTNQYNIANDQAVADSLDALDTVIGDIAGMANVGGNLGTDVATSLDGLDAAIGTRNYTSTKYVTAGDDLTTAVSSLDQNLEKVENRVAGLEDRTQKMNREMKAGFASLAAMSALVPNARSAGDTQISLGTGYYRGTAGFALGAFHHFNDNVMMNVGAGYSAHGAGTFRAGVTFGF